mmetsp:Transcript_1628/g.4220  ORF Transcript_1628/g.4220 Transcript_1628/m.4220 type:complete len:983 (+) Transcript_1628:120-3068(+)
MSATVQLQRELLETILEEKTERMQAMEALVGTVSALKQDNIELRRMVTSLQAAGSTTPLAPTPTAADYAGLQDLQARMDAIESANQAAKVFSPVESPNYAPSVRATRPGSTCDEEELEARQAADAEEGKELEYVMQESMWDLAVLIGLPGMGALGSVHAAILLFCNITIQTVFCLLAQFNFTVGEFDSGTISEVEDWRIGTAHDYTHIDPLTDKALRTRVCGEDSSLYISGSQLDMFTQIISYLPEFDKEPLESMPDWSLISTMRENLNGVWMCLLAVSCYYLSIMRELHSIWDKIKVFSVIPRGRTTLLSSDLTFKRIAVARYISIVVIAIIRLLLVLSLFYTGTLFLVHDIGVADLLLNAVALEFVLNVDELIFTAVAPVSGKLFMSKIKPLEVPHSRLRYKGMDFKSVFFTFLVPLAVYLAWMTELDPMVQEVKEAYKLMCELPGQDFVYYTTLDGFVGLSLSTPDGGNDEDVILDEDGTPQLASLFKDLQEMVVRRIVYGDEILPSMEEGDSADTTGQFNKLTDMPTWGTRTFEELTETLAIDCVDNWGSSAGIFKQVRWLLEQLFQYGTAYQNRTLTGCADFADLCQTLQDPPGTVAWSTLARFICPETCGCRELVGLFSYIPDDEQGCSSACKDNWADGNGPHDPANQSYPCTDWSTEALQRTSWWRSWTQQDWAQAYGQGNITSTSGTGNLYQDGCNAIPALGFGATASQQLTGDSDYILFCYGGLARQYEGTHSHKPLVTVCPDRCGCNVDPSLGATSLASQVALRSQLVDEQRLECPSSCSTNLGCGSQPGWVCNSDDNSRNEEDMIFIDEDAYEIWSESCTRDGEHYNEFVAQLACYDCETSSPTWLCNALPSQLQQFQQGGQPHMPADIFVYKDHEDSRGQGSSAVAYYSYCKLNSSEIRSVNETSTAYSSWYLSIAKMCYEWFCNFDGNQVCNYCGNDNYDVNDQGWTFNCTSQQGGGDQNGTDGGGFGP